MNRPPSPPLIPKKQSDPHRFRLYWTFFDSARAGLEAVLRSGALRNKTVLLPAYIGISTREGSGVFDPIRQTCARHEFYRLDHRLHIRLDDLESRIRSNPGQILLLIHYFGFKDPNLQRIQILARQHRLTVIEDFAQAFFTFWAHPRVDFDFGLFSVHKMFPYKRGGFVLSRKSLKLASAENFNLMHFDMQAIIAKRLENYRFLARSMQPLTRPHRITILRRNLRDCVPQTFPILLPNSATRDALYFDLNHHGFGAVSLYHSLIPQIGASFIQETALASRILNLPVHQDADLDTLALLMQRFTSVLHRKTR